MADYHGRQSDDDNGRYSDEESGTCHGGGGGGGLREQDRLLPIANVSRIMKRALPANGKISKDAKETVQECVSEFISFVTGEASDKCQREKRKTVNGDDLLWAMATLGFEDYVDPLKLYLQRYREMEGEKTPSSTSGTATSSVSASMARRNDQDSGGSMGGNYLPNTQVYGHQLNPLMYSQPYHMSMQNNNGGGPPGPPPGNAGGG